MVARLDFNKIGITVNVKFQTHFSFLFSNKILVFRAGTHKMLVRIANSLIWVCAVCLGFCGRQLLLEILEHLS